MPVLASGRAGSNEPFFNKAGTINASSQADLLGQISAMLQAVASREVTFDHMENAGVDTSYGTVAERRAHVIEAFNDKSSNKWAELGSNIGAVIYETIQRQGFMRRFLLRADLQQGNDPRLNVRFQNVTAMVASGPASCNPRFVKEKYLMPPEFYVEANPRLELKEINRGTSDLLDDVFARAQEQIMVAEDRAYLNMLNQSVGLANNLQVLTGGLTPSNVANFRAVVAQWGLPTSNLMITPAGWSDIVGNASAWGNLFDPVTQYEIVQTGYLGRLLGMPITTDGFRDPNQRVLGANDVFLISDPVNHGAYTDRGPVEANPTDGYYRGEPSRGWYMVEILSMAVANVRSFVKGQRA